MVPLNRQERTRLESCVREARAWEARRARDQTLADVSGRLGDLDALDRVLSYDLPARVEEAFTDFARLLIAASRIEPEEIWNASRCFSRYEWHELRGRPRAWVREYLEKWEPIPTRLTGGEIHRGREVETPTVLRNLPTRPPGMR